MLFWTVTIAQVPEPKEEGLKQHDLVIKSLLLLDDDGRAKPEVSSVHF